MDTIELFQNIEPVGAKPLYFGEITASLIKFSTAEPFVAWGLNFDFPADKNHEIILYLQVSSLKERVMVFVIMQIMIVMPMTYNVMATQTRFSEYFCLNPFSA